MGKIIVGKSIFPLWGSIHRWKEQTYGTIFFSIKHFPTGQKIKGEYVKEFQMAGFKYRLKQTRFDVYTKFYMTFPLEPVEKTNALGTPYKIASIEEAFKMAKNYLKVNEDIEVDLKVKKFEDVVAAEVEKLI